MPTGRDARLNIRANRVRRSTLFLARAALVLPLACPGQTVPAPDAAAKAGTPIEGSDLGEVVVTARRRNEALQDVPISITAITAATLEQQNITDLHAIANFTPGLYDQETGSGRADRGFEQIVIRGITDVINPTVSVFLDGAPVPAQLVQNIGSEIARVEVLRGPQSAAFGQQTFSGAINYVTRDPGNDYHASTDALFGNYDWDDVRATVEGPVVRDVLALRVSARYYTFGGMYDNLAEPGEKLGTQSTWSLNGTLVFKPVENLRVKAFAQFIRDNDGTGAYGTFSNFPTNLFNCNAGAPPTNVPNYICGTVPHYPASQIGLNSTPYPQFVTQVLQNSTGTLGPLFSMSLNDHGGLVRNFLLGTVAIDWTLPGIATLSSLTSADTQHWQVIQDLDGRNTLSVPNTVTPFPPTIQEPSYTNWLDVVQQQAADWSEEIRLASPTDQRFRWLVGGSFHNYDERDWVAALIPFGLFEFVPGALNRTATTGVFGSLNFDILPPLTLTFDGRYQWLRLEEYNYSPETLLLGQTFPEFAPRVSLQYKISSELNTYVTYSKGYESGIFNVSVLALPPAVQQQLFSQYQASIIGAPSTLDNYELGVKGSLFDKRLEFTADIFYDLWGKQIVSQSPVVVVNNVPDEVPVFSSIGKSTVPGAELEGLLHLTDHWTLNVAAGYADPTYAKTLPCPQCAGITGASTVTKGTVVPGSSKANAAVGLNYSNRLSDTLDWFARADYFYRSGVYVDLVNVAKTPDTDKVNLRVGLNAEHWGVQVFVLNLTNDYAYNGVSEESAPLGGNGIIAALPTLRQFGAKVSLKY